MVLQFDNDLGYYRDASAGINISYEDDSIQIFDEWGEGVTIENEKDYNSFLKALRQSADKLNWKESQE